MADGATGVLARRLSNLVKFATPEHSSWWLTDC